LVKILSETVIESLLVRHQTFITGQAVNDIILLIVNLVGGTFLNYKHDRKIDTNVGNALQAVVPHVKDGSLKKTENNLMMSQ
jgi:hypothetical protein